MAAGLGFKDFTTGEVLTAADVDGYLMQGIWVFASAAARDAAVTSPQEGNFAFLKDTNTTTYYTGSAWTNLDTTGMVNPMTTTGDTIYSSSGSTPARLGIGSTGQVLTVAGGVPSWATPSSGGGMTLLSTTSLSGASTTISSISGAYKDLIVIGYGLNATNSTQPYFQPLSTNIADYSSATTYGATAAVENFRTSALHFTGGQNLAPTNTDNGFQVQITQYASTSVIYKPFIMTSRVVSSASPSTMTIIAGGSINTSSAIDSIKIGVGTGTITGTILIYGVN